MAPRVRVPPQFLIRLRGPTDACPAGVCLFVFFFWGNSPISWSSEGISAEAHWLLLPLGAMLRLGWQHRLPVPLPPSRQDAPQRGLGVCSSVGCTSVGFRGLPSFFPHLPLAEGPCVPDVLSWGNLSPGGPSIILQLRLRSGGPATSKSLRKKPLSGSQAPSVSFLKFLLGTVAIATQGCCVSLRDFESRCAGHWLSRPDTAVCGRPACWRLPRALGCKTSVWSLATSNPVPGVFLLCVFQNGW